MSMKSVQSMMAGEDKKCGVVTVGEGEASAVRQNERKKRIEQLKMDTDMIPMKSRSLKSRKKPPEGVGVKGVGKPTTKKSWGR